MEGKDGSTAAKRSDTSQSEAVAGDQKGEDQSALSISEKYGIPEPHLFEDKDGDDVDESLTMQLAVGAKKFDRDGLTCLKFESFPPTTAGLIRARKVCRSEMAKIVNEVDLITKEPKLAIDTRRDDFFLEPMIYKHLLPVSL